MNAAAENRNCLHLVVRSSAGAMESVRSQFQEGDAVLFLDDGVMQLAGRPGEPFVPPFRDCYFSGVDLEARGLAGFATASAVLADTEIAQMVQAFGFCLTWK